MRFCNIKLALLALVCVLASPNQVFCATTTTLTAASGGSAISAADTGGAWTTLTGPVLVESAPGAIGGGRLGQPGTIVLSAPGGFEFNPNAPVVVRVAGSATASENINGTPDGGTLPVSITSTTLTLTVTTPSSSIGNTLTWQNIQVRPTAATPLAAGDLTESGTCTFQRLTGTWGALTEVAGRATRLAFATQPAGATAGAPWTTQPVVMVQDQFGNNSTNGLAANSFVTVTLSSGPGPLQGTTALALVLSSGQATAAFADLRIDTAGTNQQLTASSTNGLASGLSTVFTVSPAAATQLALVTPPSATAVAGVPFAQQPVVQIQDAFNNLRTSDTPLVTVVRAAGTGLLQGTTNILAVGGIATFTNLAHAYATNITLAFASGSLTGLSSASISVSPGAPSQLQLLLPGETAAPATPTGKTGSPNAQMAAAPFSVRLNAVDAFWNLVSTGTNLVSVTSSDTTATLPAPTALVNGAAAATVALKAAGTQTLTATATGLLGASTAVTVNPGAPASLLVLMPGETLAPGTATGKTGLPAPQTAGVAFPVTVYAVDPTGNPVVSSHNVTLSASDPHALLPATAALAGGTHTFNLTFRTAGNWTVTATDVSTGPLAPGTGSPTAITPGAFTQLQVLVPGEIAAPGTPAGKSGTPLNQTNGVAFPVTVYGVDSNWNPVDTNDTIRVGASDTQATLPAAAPLTAGTGKFNVALWTVGPATLTASNLTHASIRPAASSTLTNLPGGLVTNRFDFVYADRQSLLADGWDFLARSPGGAIRNTEITNTADGALVSYDQIAHPGVLRLPTDVGDLWGPDNNTRNSLFRNLSSNWLSLRLDFTFAPTANDQQVQLGLYQDDDNYLQVGHVFSSSLGGEAVTLLREDDGAHASWSPLTLGRVNLSASRMQLRLDRDLASDKILAFYSLDNTNWVSVGQAFQALANPRLCLWAGGSSAGFPNCDLRRVEVITSVTPLRPLLVVQPQHLVFNAVAGQPCTNLQQLRVVAQRALTPQGYTVASSAPWLLTTPGETNTPGFCDVGINPAGLTAGLYEGMLTCSAPGATSAVARVTLVVNPAIRAQVARWRGAKAGAMSVWVDDAQPTAFDELTANGFAGTYLLWGDPSPPTPSAQVIPAFFTNYFAAGMELGGHTVDHLCVPLGAPAVRYELEANLASICARTPQPSNSLICFAFPCGDAPVPAQVAAADYCLAVHGYNLNQFEEPLPYNFMCLKTFNSHEHAPYPPADFKPLVDTAVAQGKWLNLVLHATNNSDGAISYAAGKDLWVAPGGTVTKYILQRARTVLTNYQESAGQLSFSFYRLPLDPSSVRSFESALGPQDTLTFQVDITGTNGLYSVTLDGNPVASTAQLRGGRTFMVFEAPVKTTPQTALLRLLPNRPPVLPALADQLTRPGVPLLVTNRATDPDAPAQALTYSLPAAPAGAQIDSEGIIRWTPEGSQKAGTYAFTTIVSDNGQPTLRATNRFTATLPAADWLALPAPVETVVYAGQSLLYTNTASYHRPLDAWKTNTVVFNYTNRTALLADGWNFIAQTPGVGPRNTELTNPNLGALLSYDQAQHPGTLRVPCDLGDLWAGNNSSRNALFRSLPTNWTSLQLALAFAPTQDFQQVHLALTQDDDNYLQVGYAFNGGLGGPVATLILETNASPDHFFSGLASGVSSLFLRLDQAGTSGQVTAFYSLDRLNWLPVGAYQQAFVNPRLSIWAGGSPVPWATGLPSVDLRQLEVVVSNSTPVVFTYTLLNPPDGATIDANGIIRWTPTLAQVPSTNRLTTVVTDNQVPPLSTTNTITVEAKALLTVVADNQSRLYGAANLPLTGTLTGLLPGDNITVTYTTAADATSPVGTYPIVPVLQDPDGQLVNYTLLVTNGLLTVAPAPLTVTADSLSRLYGTPNPALTGSVTGLRNQDNITAQVTATVGAGSDVGAYPLLLQLADPDHRLGNYSVTTNQGLLTIRPALLTVTANDCTRPYGATNPTFSASITGYVNQDSPAVLTGRPELTTPASPGSGVGSYPIAAAVGSLWATNYSFQFVAGTLTVSPAPLTATADSQTRFYGQTNPPLTVTYVGFVNGEDASSLPRLPELATTASTNSPAGEYPIIISGPSASNYNLQYQGGTLTVVPAPLLVAAQNVTRVYSQTNPLFTATVHGFVNSEDTNVLSGALVLDTPALPDSPVGSYPIVPSGWFATNYTLIYSNGTLTVTAYALLAWAENASRVYGETNPGLTGTLTGVQVGDLITARFVTVADSNSPAGIYPIVPTLDDPGHRLDNYSLTVSNGALTVTPAPLTVSAHSQYRFYGDVNGELTGTLSGLRNADHIRALFTTAADASTPVGSYPIGIEFSDPDHRLTNYAVTTNNGTVSIYPAPLSVHGDQLSRPYGSPNPPLTSTLLGLKNNDNITAFCWTSADISSPPGLYNIWVYLYDPDSRVGNYDIDYQNGTLQVTSAQPALRLTSSANPSLPGSNVTFTVSISALPPTSGWPSGEVQFLVDGTPLGSWTALSNGLATLETAALAHGQRLISVEYAGDSFFASATNFLSPPQIVNTPPRAGLAMLNTLQNRTAYLPASELLAQGIDADLDPLHVLAVAGASLQGGKASFNGSRLAYTPPVGYIGTDLFDFILSDSFGARATGSVFVTVSPADGAPPLLTAVQPRTGGLVLVSGAGAPGQTYRLEASTNFVDWTSIATNTAPANGLLSFPDPQTNSYSSRFYRLVTP